MVITYQGDNYFRIQSGTFTILIDPTNARSFKGANIILSTIKPALVPYEPDGASGETPCAWFENQGEYETGGVRIRACSAGENAEGKECTVYTFELEDISVGVIGYGPAELPAAVQEKLSGSDILIIPGAGAPYLSEAAAGKLVRQIEPGIVIPTFVDKEPKKLFAELGKSPAAEEKLTIKKKDITPGTMNVVWLRA